MHGKTDLITNFCGLNLLGVGPVVCVLDYIGKMVPASGGALFEVLWWYAVHLVRLQTESKSWQVSSWIVVSHQLL